MSLKQRRVATHPLEPALGPKSAPRGKAVSRKAGAVFVALGMLLLALAASDALAGVASGAVLGDTGSEKLRGSGEENWISGSGGSDTLNGFAGDDLLVGGGENDDIFGGTGEDKLLSGAGDDFVEATDGERDYVDCGAGQDTASVDAQDYVSISCERVYPG